MVKQNTSLSLSPYYSASRPRQPVCSVAGWHNAKYKTSDEGNTFLYLHISNEI